MKPEQLLKRLSSFKSERVKYENNWKQLYKYCSPERMPTFSDVSLNSFDEGKKARSELYDSTAVDGIQLLVSSIINGVTPASSKWFKAIPNGIDTPSQLTDGEVWLDSVSDFIFRNIHSSNYDSEVTDFVTDLVVAGHAILYTDQKETGRICI